MGILEIDMWTLQLICPMPAYILCRQTFAIFFDLECVQWNQGVSLEGGAEKMLFASTWDQCLRPWSREKMHRVGLNLPSLSLLAPWERHHRNTPSQPCEMWGQKVVLNLAVTYFTEWQNENLGMDTMWIIQAKEMSEKMWSLKPRTAVWDPGFQHCAGYPTVSL